MKFCKRCYHTWKPRNNVNPKICPRCKTKKWAEQRRWVENDFLMPMLEAICHSDNRKDKTPDNLITKNYEIFVAIMYGIQHFMRLYDQAKTKEEIFEASEYLKPLENLNYTNTDIPNEFGIFLTRSRCHFVDLGILGLERDPVEKVFDEMNKV